MRVTAVLEAFALVCAALAGRFTDQPLPDLPPRRSRPVAATPPSNTGLSTPTTVGADAAA